MTLLLLCYICGQSEKVRLSMRLIIIGVALYIFSFGGSTIYAHSHQIGENQSSAQYNTNSPVESTLTTLIEGIDRYPSSILYSGKNHEFYKLVLKLLEEKENDKDLYYLEKVITIIDSMSSTELNNYKLHREGLLTGLQAVKHNAEKTAIGGTGGNTFGSIYTVTDLGNGYVGLQLIKDNAYRFSFFVNDRYISSCEGRQCRAVVLPANKGDTVKMFYMMNSMDRGSATMQSR